MPAIAQASGSDTQRRSLTTPEVEPSATSTRESAQQREPGIVGGHGFAFRGFDAPANQRPILPQPVGRPVRYSATFIAK